MVARGAKPVNGLVIWTLTPRECCTPRSSEWSGFDERREGRWWIIDVPEIDYRTQARNLKEIDEMARSLIAGATNEDEGSFDVLVDIQMPEMAGELLRDAERREEEARIQMARAAEDRRRAVRDLQGVFSLSSSDIATLLRVSRGRVYQLLKEGTMN